MLVNPELEHLDLADLRQRYNDTYIMYDNQLSYVNGFVGNEAGDKIFIMLHNQNAAIRFDWKKLDTYRPPPRFNKIGRDLVWSHYRFKRQWKRGISPGDNWVYNMTVGAGNFSIAEAIRQFFSPTTEQIVHVKELDDVEVLSPNLAFGDMRFWYRGRSIATLVNDTIVHKLPFMKDEVQQYVKGAKHEFE